MDDEELPPSETTVRRSKRIRVQTQAATAAAAAVARTSKVNITIKNVTAAPSSGQRLDHERNSVDDFENVPPTSKRSRPSEGTSSEPRQLDEQLIDVIKGKCKLIPQVVKGWVDFYENHPKPALAELLMMLFEVCGAKYHIDEDMLETFSVDNIVFALVTLAEKGNVEDYQNSNKKELQNFKDNIVLFWDTLVTDCQNGPLLDGVLMEKCTDYVIALSCTAPRVYRQVASLVGLQLVTSIISVAKMLGSQRETTQRQLNAEKKKRTEGPCIDSLSKRLSETQPKINALESMMTKIFQGLFVHRYRDIDPNIRTSCIQSLGVWIMSYPSLFLHNKYLKYLGWSLNDKSAGVRKASVLALQNLYEGDHNVPSLNLFTERFSNRMFELADDIDVSVAVSGIGLAKQLLSHQLLSNDDLGSIYDLLVDYSPEIRRAVGALVYENLIAQQTSGSHSGRKGADKESSEVHLGRMLQILREFSTEPILSTYVIDDIWEYMEAMKDWKCIISMLLDENPSIELTEEDATNLIRLLCASVKKAIGERIVPATDNRKQYYNKVQRETFKTNRKDITVSMIKNYSRLLKKFMSEKAKIPSLAELVLHMNLELYSLKRQEQHFKTVVQLLKEIFKHGGIDALRSCVKAINFCTTQSKGELQDYANSKLKELEDELYSKLKSAIKDVADGDDEYSLLVNMKRLYELQLSRFVAMENLYEDIFVPLQNMRNMDDEVVTFVLLNMYLHVAWCLHSIINSKSVSEASIASLLSKRNALFGQLEHYLDLSLEVLEEGLRDQLASIVRVIFAEVWCLFQKENFNSTKLEMLGFSPDQPLLQKFWKLCERQLNISDDKELIEETNRDAVVIAAVSGDYLGPEIISHFVKHGESVAEIVKHLIAVLKKKDDDVPGILLEALKRVYDKYVVHLSNRVDGSLQSKSFQDFKDQAARISGVFAGTARIKHRSDILRIVKDGTEYAFLDAPKQMTFLEGSVLPFVAKLPATDAIDVLKDVQKHAEDVDTDEDPSGWRPYHTFVNTLCEKHLKNEEEKEGATVKRRGRSRKPPNLQGKKLFDENSSSEQEDSISASDHDDQEDDDKQEDEDIPLIHSIRSSAKLRMRALREKDIQTKASNSGGTSDRIATSRTQGARDRQPVIWHMILVPKDILCSLNCSDSTLQVRMPGR